MDEPIIMIAFGTIIILLGLLFLLIKVLLSIKKNTKQSASNNEKIVQAIQAQTNVCNDGFNKIENKINEKIKQSEKIIQAIQEQTNVCNDGFNKIDETLKKELLE